MLKVDDPFIGYRFVYAKKDDPFSVHRFVGAKGG